MDKVESIGERETTARAIRPERIPTRPEDRQSACERGAKARSNLLLYVLNDRCHRWVERIDDDRQVDVASGRRKAPVSQTAERIGGCEARAEYCADFLQSCTQYFPSERIQRALQTGRPQAHRSASNRPRLRIIHSIRAPTSYRPSLLHRTLENTPDLQADFVHGIASCDVQRLRVVATEGDIGRTDLGLRLTPDDRQIDRAEEAPGR